MQHAQTQRDKKSGEETEAELSESDDAKGCLDDDHDKRNANRSRGDAHATHAWLSPSTVEGRVLRAISRQEGEEKEDDCDYQTQGA